MNFLNKKHIPTHTNSYFTNSATKGFVNSNQNPNNTSSYINSRVQSVHNNNNMGKIKQSPKTLYHNPSNSRVARQKQTHQQQHFSSSYSQNYNIKSNLSNQNNNIQTNLCPQHDNQVLRHLCLQCNQLLCSQCISDHLQGHRQTTNTIPKIQTINRLRKQMGTKIQGILNFMEESNPHTVLPDIHSLKIQAIQKINQMKRQVIKAFDQWCRILQSHVLEDLVKLQQIAGISHQMNNLKQQVVMLNSQLKNSSNPSVQIVKKIHKIDSQKLQAAYLQMFNKFSKNILKSKFTFDYNWNYLMESFEKTISLRPLYAEKVNEQNKQKPIQYQENENYNKFSQYNNNTTQLQSQKQRLHYQKRKSTQNINSNRNNNSIAQVDQKKLFQIQSIQSLIQPSSNQSQREKAQNIMMIKPFNVQQNRKVYEGQSHKAVQTSFSRQGSGKRLPIFVNEQKNKQQSLINNYQDEQENI